MNVTGENVLNALPIAIRAFLLLAIKKKKTRIPIRHRHIRFHYPFVVDFYDFVSISIKFRAWARSRFPKLQRDSHSTFTNRIAKKAGCLTVLMLHSLQRLLNR